MMAIRFLPASSPRVVCWTVLAWMVAYVNIAVAHSGRRLEIEVVNGKLQAQGINSGTDDGFPAVRPYTNSIHDHWRNVSGAGLATATLPGFNAPHFASDLVGQELVLDLMSVRQWVSPPLMPTAGTTPVLEPLDDGEIVSVFGAVGDTNSLISGSVVLSEQVPLVGDDDLDLLYQINTNPEDEIHVMEFILTATPKTPTAPNLLPSDPIFILLAPDGSTPQERLHHASLYLESYMATIPEPSSVTLVVLGSGILAAVARR